MSSSSSASWLGLGAGMALLAGAIWPDRLMPSPPFIPNAVAAVLVSLGIALAAYRSGGALGCRLNGTSASLLLLSIGVGLQPALHKELPYPEELLFPLATLLLATLFSTLGAGLDDEGRSKALRYWALGAAAAALISLLFQLAQWRVSAADLPGWIMRVPPGFQPFGNYAQRNQLSLLYSFAIICLGFLSVRSRTAIGAAATISLAVGCVFGIVLSGSRTGMIIGCVATLLWPCVTNQSQDADSQWRWPLARMLLALLLYVVIFGASQVVISHWSTHDQFETALSRLESANNLTRIALQEQAWQMIREHPLLGSGWGTFAPEGLRLIQSSRLPLFADNSHFYLSQLGSEMGLLGWTVGLGMTFSVGWMVWHSRSSQQWACSAIVLLVWLASITEYPMWLAFFLLPVALVAGLGWGGSISRSHVVIQREFRLRSTAVLIFALLIATGGVWSIVKFKELNRIGNRIFGVAQVASDVRAQVEARESSFGFESIYDLYIYMLIPVSNERLSDKIALGERVLGRYINTEFLARQTVLTLLADKNDVAFRLVQTSCLLHPSRCDGEIDGLRKIAAGGLESASELAEKGAQWWVETKASDIWVQQRMQR